MTPAAGYKAIDPDAVLVKMPLAERAKLLSGRGFWHTRGDRALGVPSLLLSDGPHGLRKQARRADHLGLASSLPATCFPTASALACSFDPALLAEIGRALAEECRQQDVALLLGPGVNIKRSPLCGRNFEYLSEDPLLAGQLAAAYIQGLQSLGVGGCLKHFAANSQERYRCWTDSVVDERALREIYLRPFEIAVKQAAPWAIMTAYNRLNGTFCSQHRWLMTDLARDQWGFDGLFVTDWGAMSDPVLSFRNGLDLEMPGVCRGTDRELLAAVRNGALAEGDVSRAARNVLTLASRCQAREAIPYTCDMQRHEALARDAACRSAVLLKNDGLLPLRPGARLAVIGALAGDPQYQGVGSSRVRPTRLESFCQALKAEGVPFDHAPGYVRSSPSPDPALIAQARRVARGKDAVIVFAGLADMDESEGADRTHMDLPPAQDALIRALAAEGLPLAVVLQCGSAVLLPWAEDVNAILLMHLSGQAGGPATWDLLSGRRCPEGKLAETWPAAAGDVPCADAFSGEAEHIPYRESIFVGYRYYDAAGKAVAYPFGHGLSYTAFSYGEPAVRGRTVSCTVRNTGPVPGAETVQLYLSLPGSRVFRAERELKGFRKVRLAPGQAERVSFTLPDEALAWFDPRSRAWSVEPGTYRVRIGSSSRDIRLECDLAVTEGVLPEPLAYPAGTADRAQFEALLGRPVPEDAPLRPFTLDSLLAHTRATRLGRLFLAVGSRAAALQYGRGPRARQLGRAVMEGTPLRNLGMGGGRRSMLRAAVELFNGHPLRALRQLFKSP